MAKSKAVLDETPVEVIELKLNFKPEVGVDTAKIAVSLTMRLLFDDSVSMRAMGHQLG